MAKLIRAAANRNAPIVEPGAETLTLSYFTVLRLSAGQTQTLDVPQCELLCVVLSGRADIAAGAREFRNVGRRADIWDGPADSVYCGTCPRMTVRAARDGTEVLVVGGLCEQPFAPFRIAPEEVEAIDIGSVETHSHRRMYCILGPAATGRVGRLYAAEMLVSEGCWMGYPPHKHDQEQLPDEADFEEVGHFRFRPESGFAAQFCYDGTVAEPMCFKAQHGDTFLVDRGYHPAAMAPGYQGYVFRAMVGRQGRRFAPKFEAQHRHLVDRIPGVAAMVERFQQ
ncbi:5-deoxy-glucuronate isomerase [Opitutus sp. ER46]|uniref:5-deoxy-glucuronate isomerase n=1 Tax=Opitutus sp. ER46 TaxID=2161864 RepID=UPI000D3039BB|nr:5-deoxy-glucuronate isomerase [Opitutus sp. ER46]PTX91456.1 inositol utilization protein [Opitutus sp. ER46]